MSKIVNVSHMRGQGSAVFNGKTITLNWPNNQWHEPMGPVVGGCLHWTADHWLAGYDDYPANVMYDQESGEAFIVLMLDPGQKGSHLWGRNTGIHGITLCAAVGADPGGNYGPNPPMQAQIALAAQYLAELAVVHGLDPRSHMQVDHKRANADATVLSNTGGTIEVPRFWDHQGYAHVDNYAAWRWDCQGITPHVLGYMLGYYDEIMAGTRALEFEAYLR